MQIEGFFLSFLEKELAQFLIGGRIDKISAISKNDFIFSIRQPKKTLLLYASLNPTIPLLYLTDENIESPKMPPTFCMVLRKHLEGGRIASISQVGLDRIFILDIDFLENDGKICTKSLIFELIGKKSNLILTFRGYIIDALRKVTDKMSRIRKILPHEKYVLPPNCDKVNLLNTDCTTILKLLKQKEEKNLKKALLDTLEGFGNGLVTESAFLANISLEKEIKNLTSAEWNNLHQALSSITAKNNTSILPHLYLDDKNTILGIAPFPLTFLEKNLAQKISVKKYQSMSLLLKAFHGQKEAYILDDKRRFKKLVLTEQEKLLKKIEVLKKELQETADAVIYKNFADHLMTYKYKLTDHVDDKVSLPDLYSTKGTYITIPLAKKYTIKDNITLYYKRYNKLKRAKDKITLQIAKAEEQLTYLKTIEQALVTSKTNAELEDIKSELRATCYLKEPKKLIPKIKPSLPFSFFTIDQVNILVGKNNYQNDNLTFKIARPYDVWLHTKDIPGSHVILRVHDFMKRFSDQTAFLSNYYEQVKTAALLAAYFSQAKVSTNVPVDYTFIKYVKKPAGARPGFVIFKKQKTLYVTPSKAKILSLLDKKNLQEIFTK